MARQPTTPDLHARTSDPSTSHAAMASYDTDKMTSAMAVVVSLFRTQGPMPDFELRDAFAETWAAPHDESLHRQARNQARNQGLVRDSGLQKVNPTTRRLQVVWEACDQPPPPVACCPTCGHITRGAK